MYEILLLAHMLINRDHNVESRGLSRIQQRAILQSRQSGKPCRLAVMDYDEVAQAFIDRIRPAELASNARKQQLLRFF